MAFADDFEEVVAFVVDWHAASATKMARMMSAVAKFCIAFILNEIFNGLIRN